MTINITFESLEEMRQFCGEVTGSAAVTVKESSKKKATKAPEEEQNVETPAEQTKAPESIAIEQVRKAAGNYMKENGKEAISSVLAEFGVKKVTDLSEGDYAAFMQKVGA